MRNDYSRLHRNFIHKSSLIVNRANYIHNNLTNTEYWRVLYLSESLLGNLWQHWCVFCRQVIALACRGTISRENEIISKRQKDNSWGRLGYEASCATRGHSPKPHRKINYMRHEPTWGDQDKIIDIINTINPTNKASLLTAFGLPLLGPKHLQIVRNACAHKNIETLDSVKQLLVHYDVQQIANPADLAWEVSLSDNTCGIYAWVEHMQTIADLATKTK